MKTKIKKAISLISIVGIFILNTGNIFAAPAGPVGTTDVINTTGNSNVSTGSINYDGVSSASGSVSGIKVIATVDPILNLTISGSIITLGNIHNSQSGSLDLEVGTNSPSGVVVTAQSQNSGLSLTGATASGGLINSSNGTYKYSSKVGGGAEVASATYANSTDIDSTNPLEIYKSNETEISSNNIDDITFVVEAQAPANAPAGDYEDYITFTITATF